MSNRVIVTTAALLAALSAAALAGCASPTVEADEKPAAVQETKPSAEPMPTPADGCERLSEITFADHAPDAATTTVSWRGPDLVDRGAAEQANGTVAFAADGRIASYTVAAGDALIAVGDRFCVEWGSVMRFNHNAAGVLHPGDVLQLLPDPAVPFPLE